MIRIDGLHLRPGKMSAIGNDELALVVEQGVEWMKGVLGIALGEEFEALARQEVSHTGPVPVLWECSQIDLGVAHHALALRRLGQHNAPVVDDGRSAIRGSHRDVDVSDPRRVCRYHVGEVLLTRCRDGLLRPIREDGEFEVQTTAGACFAFLALPDGIDAETFAWDLLSARRVVTVPGIHFGRNWTGYLRLSFGRGTEAELEKAGRRIVSYRKTL